MFAVLHFSLYERKMKNRKKIKKRSKIIE